MILQRRPETIKYRNEEFEIIFHYYYEEESGLEFTTTELDELNINQAYNKYRENHHIPFPAELVNLREKFGVSAAKMSQILGFGTNTYRLYESGDMPSIANARLINLVSDQIEFVKLIEQSDLPDKAALIIKVSKPKTITESVADQCLCGNVEHMMGNNHPNGLNGYSVPNFTKLVHLIVFFSNEIPGIATTKMNKLLFYADFLNFKRHGYSITGAHYQAVQWGPVPRKYTQIFDACQEKEYVVIKTEFWDDGKERFQFLPHKKTSFDATFYNQKEIETIHRVLGVLGAKTTTELVKISHLEKAWVENEQTRSLINYEYAFDLKAI